MDDREIPLGLDGHALAILFASSMATAVGAVLVGAPALAPVAAGGVGVGLGGGLLWGQFHLRRAVARQLLTWGESVEDVRLADGGFVPRWEVRLDGGDRTVALVGTAFGPQNPLFLEDEDGLRRV
ncbi:hypothetical protein HWV07_14500 [Natronomonas salina]|uniref:hypothetical protein n=1 Tax=Natronomonas salina TaxID=1710540 RepID=UPI0015B5D410|nr:hypothetical protein [Natronomonas salina]QLD90176.1 hypothetical protein HWV07_14500 [Natronomonas salina]